jgi:branched-chain amino acid transport system substrate-binding protein
LFNPGDINMKLKTLVAALAVGLGATGAFAQTSTGPVKIGFITDMSSLYADIDGPAGGEMIKWAAQDFGGKVLGRPIEVLTADHQNKADVASSKAREWMDKENLSMLVGGTSSGTALAMAKVASEKKRPFIVIGAGSARLTNEDCSPYTVHYAYDTVALAKVAGNALVKAGNKNWYFLTADYAFGYSLEGRRLQRGQGQWRHGDRCGAPPAERVRLLVVPAAGTVQQGADPGPGQRRR